MERISVSNLYKSYGNNNVLKGISIEAKEGEILGVLGPSGAGKTTLVEILIGHLKYDKGCSRVFGIDSLELKDSQYEKIGTVLDETGLFDRLSCKQNLEVFRKIYGINKNEIDTVLLKVGLESSVHVAVDKLSKGMKQRLVLARAIMHNPQLLFLDEPTSGLDPSTAQVIHKLLLELKENGTTILLVTHNMQEATDLCDRVAFLFDGKIIEYDSPSNICQKYNTLNEINIILEDGTELQFNNDSPSSNIISKLFIENCIKSIHSSEPTLGDIFIELTGKELI